MPDTTSFFSDSLKKLNPYSPIEPPDQIAKRLGIAEEKVIKLDANENPYGTASIVLKALSEGNYYHIYPDPAQKELRRAIGEYVGVEADQIVGGTGADELIDLSCRLLLEPGDAVLSFTPTFSYYSHVVALNKGEYIVYPRNKKDYSISLDLIQTLDFTQVKLVLLCSPNNPTGNLLSEEVLDFLLDQEVIVCVDEAYYEFSRESFVCKLKQHNNLVILRTFSKCFGLAGLRVGYGIMSKELASGMMRIKPPYSVNMAAEVALKTCLQNIAIYDEQIKQIIQTRQWVQDELESFPGLKVYPSRSNYILMDVYDRKAIDIRSSLEKKGILVRYFDTKQLSNCLRVSMGTDQQMEVLIKELKTLL
ncbi:MAG: histidinol-phosphate transaminase [Proteobacteria bacterium]|nr:histidinol-phosphate transaminase [Pseudomonadota bacterium]